ncbi:MAG: DEAD/DEAH box helicase [Phycisphaerales bacterium]|nr:DEAD/DEAH box helicase [Phycisphaerales bacterium]
MCRSTSAAGPGGRRRRAGAARAAPAPARRSAGSGATAGRPRRRASPRASATWRRSFFASAPPARACPGTRFHPTPPGRRPSRKSSPTTRPRTSSPGSRRSSATCSDVGFGKTELAVRAAFKAAEDGRQVAVLVPTTVLAEQHEETFRGRFADYPFKVESVSRFKSDSEVREVLERLAAGRVDVIIGTHRLLSKDVVFKDLGLVVVDEEQRFGVEHKERLLALRMTADVLTLSATPIPRTLHMGMIGLRDISSLATPPVDRRAVVTEVIPRNPTRLKQIIERELARDGQVFYVHNRVHDIHSVAADVQRLAPNARIVVGHGQMPPHQLEDVMLKFMRRPPQADILVSTTIIESGIDIPTANTMIIEDADRFGLAELHQLRGRVGRSKHRGYCYLLLPDDRPLREKAKQRLKALEQFSMLGAGFKIAIRDLEIRGAGNILGPEQSGHIAAVGYDMYCQLLDRAVKGLKNEAVAAPSETAVEIGVSGSIPKPYIPSDMRRLEAYRRIALAGTPAELDKVRADLVAAYGDLPEPADRLLMLAALRTGARAAGVRLISVRDPDVILRTSDPAATAAALTGAPGKVTVLPRPSPGQLAEVYFRPHSGATLAGPALLTVLGGRFSPLRAPLPDRDREGTGRPQAAPPSHAGQQGQQRAGAQQPPPTPPTRKPNLKPPPLPKELKALKRTLRGGQGGPPAPDKPKA